MITTVEKVICRMISMGIRITTAFFILRKRKERKCLSVTTIFLGASYADGVHAHTRKHRKVYILCYIDYLPTIECEKKRRNKLRRNISGFNY